MQLRLQPLTASIRISNTAQATLWQTSAGQWMQQVVLVGCIRSLWQRGMAHPAGQADNADAIGVSCQSLL